MEKDILKESIDKITNLSKKENKKRTHLIISIILYVFIFLLIVSSYLLDTYNIVFTVIGFIFVTFIFYVDIKSLYKTNKLRKRIKIVMQKLPK